MKLFYVALFILMTSAHANEEILSFKNDREGKSYYSGVINDFIAKRTLKRIDKAEVVEIYREVLKKQNPRKLCAYDFNKDLTSSLHDRAINVDLKGIIYILRQENEIDDVVAKILLTSNEVKTTIVSNFSEEDNSFSVGMRSVNLKMDLLSSFEKRFAEKSCADEAYRNYYAELQNIDSKINSNEIKQLNILALSEKRISDEVYTFLEQARTNELEKTTLSLLSYHQKIQSLRTQYPLRNPNEKSDFTNTKIKKMKSNLRQHLLENYTDLQIVIMGNVVKKLRARLEYDAVIISGYKNGELQENIPLEPMERFRFAIKILRKEMSLLALNSYFGGASPSYLDLMMASYELGIIPASELDTVASLEDVWNPKKTLWDKAGIWVRTFSSVATLAIPAPFGFIPALVIVAIEASVTKKNANSNDPTELF